MKEKKTFPDAADILDAGGDKKQVFFVFLVALCNKDSVYLAKDTV